LYSMMLPIVQYIPFPQVTFFLKPPKNAETMETQDVVVRCFLHISNFSASVAAFHPRFLMLRCPYAHNVIFHEIFSACLLSESQVYPMLVRYIPLFHMMFPFIFSIFFNLFPYKF
jgi:hypothetical protein